jgi:DDE superfamily endonuclease
MTESTKPATAFPLLTAVFALLLAHRVAFGQERPFQRTTGLVLGWLVTVERHTITRVLAALGLVEADWSAFYRLLGRPRFDYDRLTRQLVRETLPLAPVGQPYLVLLDGVMIPRHSRTMPGTGWALAPRTAPFRRGLQRAQRFVDLCWLPLPNRDGYSRAVPLCWEPAFSPKAVAAAGVAPRTEWAAGMAGVTRIRADLDAAGRTAQRLLAIGDGSYAGKALWQGLPDRVDLVARCAKNRALFALPPARVPGQKGRARVYGDQAPHPADRLAERNGWRHRDVVVRGRTIPLTFRIDGPYLLKGAAGRPLFLLGVKGVAKTSPRHKRRDPAFWLVSARRDETGAWALPYPAVDLLAWAWQRWEIEVAHREQKTGFGLGEPQCWGPRSAVTAVQLAGWIYGLTVLAGLRTWGLGRAPTAPATRWWRGGGRWSLGQLWTALRAECWDLGEFRPVWARTGGNWWEMTDWLGSQTNALLGASRT